MLLWLLLLCQNVQADFTTHFRSFIHKNYGIAIAQALERTDLGNDASHGGKEDDDDDLRNQAVILIHDSGEKIIRYQVIANAFSLSLNLHFKKSFFLNGKNKIFMKDSKLKNQSTAENGESFAC